MEEIFIAYPRLVSLRSYVRRIFQLIRREEIIQILNKASEIRKKAGAIEFPVNVTSIASYVGAIVIGADISVDGYVMHFSWLKDISKGKKYLILVNKNTHITRQRFTIAHEIGHIMLGHLEKNLFRAENKLMEDNLKEEEIDQLSRLEIEANLFAGEILVPAKILYHLVSDVQINSISELAAMFEVSKHVIFIQSELLGITRYLSF